MIWKFERDISPLRGFDMTINELFIMTNKDFVNATNKDLSFRPKGEISFLEG